MTNKENIEELEQAAIRALEQFFLDSNAIHKYSDAVARESLETSPKQRIKENQENYYYAVRTNAIYKVMGKVIYNLFTP